MKLLKFGKPSPKGNDYFYKKRSEQNEYWLMETINEQNKHFITLLKFKNYLTPLKAVQNDEISPFAAAQLLLKIFRRKTNFPTSIYSS
jgi:LAO/AO transport system kinase